MERHFSPKISLCHSQNDQTDQLLLVEQCETKKNKTKPSCVVACLHFVAKIFSGFGSTLLPLFTTCSVFSLVPARCFRTELQDLNASITTQLLFFLPPLHAQWKTTGTSQRKVNTSWKFFLNGVFNESWKGESL